MSHRKLVHASAFPISLAAVLLVASCSDSSSDSGTPGADASVRDLGMTDAEPAPDAAADSGTADAEPAPDAESTDAESDAGTVVPPDMFPRLSCAMVTGTCHQFTTTASVALLDRLNDLEPDTTIILSSGRFMLNTSLTIRGASGVKLLGQGIDVTIADFSRQSTQGNGVDVIADQFTIEHFTIFDSVKDGVRIEDSTDVAIRFLKATWPNPRDTSNGSYGIYPVRCTNVLMEDSEAYNASDAGLYIGQSVNVIVRRNVARGNVAGLEIENVQYADVYENVVEENAGGLLIFDLPGNPVIGRDIRIHHNIVRNNNTPNFAASGTTVSHIPRGTGTFALASRRVEIDHNTYEVNDTTNVAVLNGLAVESSSTAWQLRLDEVRGSTVGLDLPTMGGLIWNFRTSEIWVHDNTHMGSGTAPDMSSMEERGLGYLLWAIYGPALMPADSIMYDGIAEVVDPRMAANNTNYNHICVENETGATYATLNLEVLLQLVANQMVPRVADLYRPQPPFVPFNCSGFTGGPIMPVVLPPF